MSGERDPLLSQSKRFYFLHKQDESYQGGTTDSVRDNDGGLEAEFAPRGTTEGEFAPRQVVHNMVCFFLCVLFFCLLLLSFS